MQSKTNAAIADRVRVVIIEEHELFRTGLCLLLSREPGLEIVGDAATLSDAMSLVQRKQPDVVVLGISPKDNLRVDLLPEIFGASETTKVLALSGSNDQELHRRVIRFGAAGVLSKNTPAKMLLKAIERVNAGEAWLDRSTTASLLRELSSKNQVAKQDPEQMKIASLSEREREVIKLVGKGLKNKQIADLLFISDVTVHHHLSSIYSKLEVADRLELLIYSYRNGLAELPR